MNNTQSKPISLEEFLQKAHKLHRLIESSWKLSRETRENIQWYCDWRLHQYYKLYLQFLESQHNFSNMV